MSIKRIGLIDYGMGNLHSVSKALSKAGAEVSMLTLPAENFDAIVLPGVGNFGDAIKRLREKKLDGFIREWILNRKPYLGICLGLQLLFEESEESPGIKGLGIYKGRVKKIPSEINNEKLIIPAMGWNIVEAVNENILFNSGRRYYFVHSYYVDPEDKKIISGISNYGIEYTAAIAEPPLYAMQFHPEKSGQNGIDLLKKFIDN